MIAIVNYGLGNVQAIANIYNRLGIPARIVSTADELADAGRVILPGVGAFDRAMARLNESGMRSVLDRLVLGEGKPALGICVGMQMMARRSEEGVLDGLGWIAADVRRVDRLAPAETVQMPHMGWNDVQPVRAHALLKGLETSAQFYFLHSYYVVTDAKDDVAAVTSYGAEFASIICRDRICGAQCHPEKSHGWGIQLLKNFATL